MKITQLLEGSEVLYHRIGTTGLMKIIESGTIVMSQLTSNHQEVPVTRKITNIDKTMYYLSLARSLNSSYMRNSAQKFMVVFQFSGRRLTKYGKIVPIDFFHNSEDGSDEMEDRLISNHGVIPINIAERVFVTCPNDKLPQIKRLIDKFAIPVMMFRTPYDLMIKRNGVPFEDYVRDLHPDYFNISDPEYFNKQDRFNFSQGVTNSILDHMFEYIEAFLDGKKPEHEIDSQTISFLRSTGFSKILWMLRVTDHKRGHEIYKKLIKKGFKEPENYTSFKLDMIKWLEKITNNP